MVFSKHWEGAYADEYGSLFISILPIWRHGKVMIIYMYMHYM